VAQTERVEAEQRAALEAPAKAEKAKKIVEAEAQAEQTRIGALAEAEAIRARLSAQAEGEYQILAKRAEAIGQMVDKAGGAEQAYRLMLIEHLPKLMEIHASAIRNIKFDKVVLWSGGHGNGNGGDGKTSVGGFVGDALTSLPPLFQVLQDVAGFRPNPALGVMDGATGTAAGAAPVPPAKSGVTG
jgi:flotillin